jgi:GTPase SAR1 family protein
VEAKMSSSSIRDELFRNNPFFSGIAGDPWDNEEFDVFSLNQDAYEHICQLIQTKNHSPRTAFAGLVLGESGMGKTHFLKRLLDHTLQNDIGSIFVSVKPLLNPEKPMRHLLREIVVNLEKVEVSEENLDDPSVGKREKIPQFEYLVLKIIQRHQKDNLGFDIQQAIAYFKRHCPGIDENLLKAVFKYRDVSQQSLILTWLEGRVDDDHVSILGMPDREKMSDMSLEEEAHNIIVSLGMLSEYCGMTMVICFDQLDTMRNPNLIAAFGDMIHFLVNEVCSMLPLAFIRQNTWADRFNLLDTAVIQRLSSNKSVLYGCTLEQSKELIKERIKHRYPDSVEEKFRWLMDRLKGKLKEGYTPRRVIELANEAIVRPFETTSEISDVTPPQPESDIVTFFGEEYRRERDKVNFDIKVWPPDAERLLKALSAYLESRPGYDALRYKIGKYITLTGKYRKDSGDEVDCVFMVNTADHFQPAKGAFDYGVNFLRSHPEGVCYYITDKRCKFKSTWLKTHEAKRAFEALRGISLFLGESQAIDWYGLTSLIFKVEASDVSLPASMGFRTATMEDFMRYMQEGFDKNLLNISDDPPLPPLSEELLEKKIIDILKASPMHFMAVAILSKELKSNGVIVPDDSLLKFIKEHSERMNLYGSTDDNLVMLKS